MRPRVSTVRSVLIATLLSSAFNSTAQCGNDNVLYNVPATPPCPGSTTVACVWGGEYVIVDVVAGNTYTFSTCGATWDTQITLFNNAGGAFVGYNDDGCGLQSTITWTATFTGQLRVLLDQWTLFVPCASNTTCAGLTVSCTPGTPPAGDCVYYLNLYDSFGDGWGTSNVGVSINGGAYQYYTIGNPGSSNTIPIGVNIGDVVVLSYNNSGAWQGENSYTLTMGGGGLFSSGTPPVAGISYAQTVTCNPPPAPPEDCIGSITICGNQAINNNTNNTGNVADLTLTSAGCLGALERQGTWYNFTPSAGGTVAFTINPADPLDDYDFAIWGPFPPGSTPGSICPPLAAPLRCSFAAPPGPTGLDYTATDWSETPAGDKWVQYLTVTIGQVYLLYISNFSQSGLAFNLNWNLGAGASLDCTQLGAELLELSATSEVEDIRLDWSTSMEVASSHFFVERSTDGIQFSQIGQLPAAGTSHVPITYSFLDPHPADGLNYYRLHQVDVYGAVVASKVVHAISGREDGIPLILPNPAAERTTVVLYATVAGTGALELTDGRGRTVIQRSITLQTGENRFEVDLTDLDPGVYFLRTSHGGNVHGPARVLKF